MCSGHAKSCLWKAVAATKSNLFCQWSFLDFCEWIPTFQWMLKRETMARSGTSHLIIQLNSPNDIFRVIGLKKSHHLNFHGRSSYDEPNKTILWTVAFDSTSNKLEIKLNFSWNWEEKKIEESCRLTVMISIEFIRKEKPIFGLSFRLRKHF